MIGADITAAAHLNPPRRHRSYPRAVKRARHNQYRVKHTNDHGTHHTGPPTIHLQPRPPAPTPKINTS